MLWFSGSKMPTDRLHVDNLKFSISLAAMDCHTLVAFLHARRHVGSVRDA